MCHQTRFQVNQFYRQCTFSSALLLTLLLLSSSGCMGITDDPRGERVSVSGLVYYDGDPLTSARILFISETPKGKVKSSGLVRYGVFQIPEEGGPVIGKARIEIYPTMPELEELPKLQEEAKKQGKRFIDPASVKIPAVYNKQSNLTVIVTEDGENEFEFKIKSK